MVEVASWLIVIFIVLLLFGGRILPRVGKGVGTVARSFREGLTGTPREIQASDKDPWFEGKTIPSKPELMGQRRSSSQPVVYHGATGDDVGLFGSSKRSGGTPPVAPQAGSKITDMHADSGFVDSAEERAKRYKAILMGQGGPCFIDGLVTIATFDAVDAQFYTLMCQTMQCGHPATYSTYMLFLKIFVVARELRKRAGAGLPVDESQFLDVAADRLMNKDKLGPMARGILGKYTSEFQEALDISYPGEQMSPELRLGIYLGLKVAKDKYLGGVLSGPVGFMIEGLARALDDWLLSNSQPIGPPEIEPI